MSGKQLRTLRKGLNLTQAALAHELKVKTNTITRWETSQRGIPPIAEVALKYVILKRQPKEAA